MKILFVVNSVIQNITVGTQGAQSNSWNIVVANSTIQNKILGKQAVWKIVVRNLAVANKSCKNKTEIQKNPHGSYLIWIKNEGIGDIGVSMRGLLEFILK